MKKQPEPETAHAITLADILLRPRSISQLIARSDSAFVLRTLIILAIFSALIGGLYGGIFSSDKVYLLHDAYKAPIVNILTVIFAYPVLVVFLRLFSGGNLSHIRAPFKKCLTVLSLSYTYIPLTLLLTAPGYVLSAMNNLGTGELIFKTLAVFAGVVSTILLARYLHQVYGLSYFATVPIAIIIAFYMLLLSVNLLALLAPYKSQAVYLPFYSKAASALSIVD